MTPNANPPSKSPHAREVTWIGAFALFALHLNRDARSWKFHFAIAASILFLCFQAMTSANSFGSWSQINSPGLEILKAWGNVVLLFTFFGGVGYFVRVLAVEKDLGTLALLKLTGIGPLGILAGLFGSRLVQALVIFTLQLPFVLWSITLGGVTPHQVLAMYLTLLSTLFLVGNIALFASVVCGNSGGASGFSYFLLVSPVFVYSGCQILASAIQSGSLQFSGASSVAAFALNAVSLLEAVSPYRRMQAVLVTGYDDSLINIQVTACCAIGCLLFGLSLLSFERGTTQTEPAIHARGQKWLVEISSRRKRRSQRCWDNPYLWREFQLRMHGFRGLLVSFCTCSAIYLFVLFCLPFLLIRSGYADYDAMQFRDSIVNVLQVITVVVTCVLPPAAVASTLTLELKQQTLGTLFLVAREPGNILRGLVIGRLLLVLHLLIWLSMGLIAGAMNTPDRHSVFFPIGRPGESSLPAILPIALDFMMTTLLLGIIGMRYGLIRDNHNKFLIGCIGFFLSCPIAYMLFSPVIVGRTLLFRANSVETFLQVLVPVIIYCIVGVPIFLMFWKNSLKVIRNRMSDD